MKTDYVAFGMKLKDMNNLSYSSPIDISVSEDEKNIFVSFLESLEETDNDFITRELYKVVLYDSNGNELDDFVIDSDYVLVSKRGKLYISSKMNDIINFFEQINEKYSLDMDYVWGRKPGSNYFTLIDEKTECVFKKRTYTNFDEEYEYILNVTDMETMMTLFKNVEIGEKQEISSLWKYSLEIFSKGGASLYLLRISQDNRLFNEYGYEIICEDIGSWIENLKNNRGGQK